MRGLAFLLAGSIVAPMASAAVISFDGISNATFEGSATDKNVDDLAVAGSDGTSFGFRSYVGGDMNDATLIESGKIIVNNWTGTLLMRPTSGGLFDLAGMDVSLRWGEPADFDAIGTKADNSLVTQTVVANTAQSVSFSGFAGLKEVRFNFSGGMNSSYAFFDNISYSVPEPGALGVLALSAAATLLRRRKA